MKMRLTFMSLLAALMLRPGLAALPEETQPAEGLRNRTPAVFALRNARVVRSPGRVLNHGVVVIRDGVITEVGEESPVPSDARVLDLKGKTIYAGLLDAYSEMAITGEEDLGGSPYWNRQITPQRNAASHHVTNAARNKKLRGQGITARLLAPSGGIIKGTSTIVLTGEEPNHSAILKPQVALHVRLTVPRRGRSEYPNSPMGAVALARQAMYDAIWYQQAWGAYSGAPTLPRPEQNDALEVLKRYPGHRELIVADAANELYFLRADQYAREFALNVLIRGSGREYRQLPAIKQTGRSVLLPVAFPKPPNVGTAEAALAATLEQLMHWELAPENPARLERAGVRFALTSDGLQDKGDFLARVRQAVQRGLSPAEALRAVTTTPAELLGVSEILGAVEPGKLANLVITDGDLFAKDTKVVETWVRGRSYPVVELPPIDVRGTWRMSVTGEQEINSWKFSLRVSGKPNRLSGKLTVGDLGANSDERREPERSEKLLRVGFRDSRLSCAFDGTPFDRKGVARLTVVVSAPETGSASCEGRVTWPDGSHSDLSGQRVASVEAPRGAMKAIRIGADLSPPPSDSTTAAAVEPKSKISSEVNFPLGAFGRRSAAEPATSTVLLKNATVWTCGPRGVLENAQLLVRDGKIEAIGRDFPISDDVKVIDAAGKHISPGLIDCHSHMATDGGVNESGQAITAEVRIADFINSNDITIYRQLAGGVTSSNILHGSANPIGGQNQVIKLRWGSLPDAMKFSEAPAGIKFALGENVKRSNWREPSSRYPQSRMGVDQIFRDALYAASDYQARWQAWRTSHRGLPPRRDLELEALAEVLAGERWIHCHSYRQDEILAFIRTLDGFGIQIGTFQHILEGYKVAEELARHGAMGSAFSDWWAYKIEVYDAIPYAGAIMHQAGIVVSFNSDDRELGRHLNHEAAKAVKYGGVAPDEALKFVTLNPAKQLRIDPYVGSLESGKHADFVVWSGPPLSILSRCEQTWIDGRKYFDLADDLRLRQDVAQQRNVLIQKILASGEPMRAPGETDKTDEELWPREDTFCRCHDGRE